MTYAKFKKEAEKKSYVQLSEYIVSKSYIVERFEVWTNNDTDFMCVEVMTDGEVVIYKQSETI